MRRRFRYWHTNLQVQARAALGAAPGVGELLVVEFAVDEHGRRHQRRRREGLPLVASGPEDVHHARRRRVGRAPPCVLAPPCVRTVARDVHGRRARRRLARSAPVDDCGHHWRRRCLLAIQNAPIDDRRHRWRSLCLLGIQDGVQSRQLLQRLGNDSCRARRGWRIHAMRRARQHKAQHAQSKASSTSKRKPAPAARVLLRTRVHASSGVPRPLVGARDGLSFCVLSLAIRTVPRQVPRTLHLYSKSRPRGMSLIFCFFSTLGSYIGKFIYARI